MKITNREAMEWARRLEAQHRITAGHRRDVEKFCLDFHPDESAHAVIVKNLREAEE